jgi:hypothetical protein
VATGSGRRVRKTRRPGTCKRCGSWRYLGGSEIHLPEHGGWCCLGCGLATATTVTERQEVLAAVQSHG